MGASYELLVESFDNTRVSATVESVTRSEGELLVRLSVVGDVSPVLYIRYLPCAAVRKRLRDR